MDWTQTLMIIGSILIPMLAAFGFLLTRMHSMNKEMLELILDRFDRMNERIDRIDQRISRLEGCFEERGRWESRNVSGDK